MDDLKKWYANLEPSEARLIKILAIVIGIAILYFSIWSPIREKEANSIVREKSSLNELNYAKDMATKILATKSTKKVKLVKSLSSIVTDSAKKYSISISRLQPQDGAIQLWIDQDVDFNVLLNYIGSLLGQGLILDTLDISKADIKGMVKIRRIVMVAP